MSQEAKSPVVISGSTEAPVQLAELTPVRMAWNEGSMLINSLESVDSVLRVLADRMRQIQEIEAQAEKEIDKITADKVAQARPIHLDIKNLEDALTLFIEENKDALFSESKSRELNFGTIGFRQSTKVKTKKDTLELIKGFAKDNPEFRLAIKIEEKLNKEAMKSWPVERLNQVNAKKEIKDIPFYETKEFQIKDV
ncbi:MAG: host-nuclease inhibitor Gam family protein [bacterium]